MPAILHLEEAGVGGWWHERGRLLLIPWLVLQTPTGLGYAASYVNAKNTSICTAYCMITILYIPQNKLGVVTVLL